MDIKTLGIIVAGTYLVIKKGSKNQTTGTLILSATWNTKDLTQGESAKDHQMRLKKALEKIPNINQVQIYVMGYKRDSMTGESLKHDEIEIDVSSLTKSETLLAIKSVMHDQLWTLLEYPQPEFINRY